jgi:membrane protein
MAFDPHSFPYLVKGRFWLRIWHEVNEDDCWGMAAQLSYYFLLAFLPFLVFLSALINYLPGVPGLLERLLADFYRFMPERSYVLVRGILDSVLRTRDQGVLTLGLASALWFASSAFNGMIALLNRAYQVRDTRSYLHTRTLAVLVTLVVSAFLLASGVLIFFGDWMIGALAASAWLETVYTAVRWVIIFLMLNVGVQIVYYTLPACRYPWRLVTPGGLLAVLGWVLGSLAFRWYVNHFGDFQELWGSLGALIALMLWFYLCSFFLVLGGEIDSEIHKIRRETASR